jgi:hypothetical protein
MCPSYNSLTSTCDMIADSLVHQSIRIDGKEQDRAGTTDRPAAARGGGPRALLMTGCSVHATLSRRTTSRSGITSRLKGQSVPSRGVGATDQPSMQGKSVVVWSKALVAPKRDMLGAIDFHHGSLRLYWTGAPRTVTIGPMAANGDHGSGGHDSGPHR